MGKKLLLFAVIILFIPIFISAQDCYITTNCEDNAIFSVYSDVNTHMKAPPEFNSQKVCCPGHGFNETYPTECEDPLFYYYENENSHISNTSDGGKDAFCWNNDLEPNCEFRRTDEGGCLDNEICIVSTYYEDNTHVANCSVELDYKLCCSIPRCGDGIWQENYEECDGHFRCIESGQDNQCTCNQIGAASTRILMQDVNIEEGFDYSDTIQTQMSHGSCEEDIEEWRCEYYEDIDELICACEDTQVCGDGTLDEGEQCEYIMEGDDQESGYWGAGCDQNTCECGEHYEPTDPISFNCVAIGYECGDPQPPIASFDCNNAAYECGSETYTIEDHPDNFHTNFNWTYNEDPTFCQFACADEFFWNGTHCVSIYDYYWYVDWDSCDSNCIKEGTLRC